MVKKLPTNGGNTGDLGSILWLRRAPREGNDNPLLYSCFGNPMHRGTLIGYSPWCLEESNRTEQLHFHFPLSCIGGGNGNPLQCSCLENPRDEGAWWAAAYGVAQSWTGLKRLSSSSIIMVIIFIFWLFPNWKTLF